MNHEFANVDHNPKARTQYVHDRLVDLKAGRISRDDASIIYARVMGWSDAGTESERALYRKLAGEWCDARRAIWQ